MEIKTKEYIINGIVIQVVLDGITNSEMDAIVCPGNKLGLMRGGASQAIRIIGGDSIETESKKHAPINIGKVVHLKSAGNLLCKGIIYAPAIVNPVDAASTKTIYSAAKASIKCATKYNYKTIAFPILGAGTGQVDFDDACNAILDGIFSEKNVYSSIDVVGIYIRRYERFEKLKLLVEQYAKEHT